MRRAHSIISFLVLALAPTLYSVQSYAAPDLPLDVRTSLGTMAAGDLTRLSFRVKDAEYSDFLDAIIAVSENPNQIHILDPENLGVVSIDLPAAPSCVSVGPGGSYAAVGHNGWVSYIDLVAQELVNTLAVSTDVLDIVLAGNGYMYAFPRRDQWSSIHSIEIATGTETESSGWSIYAGTLAKLHPGGQWMYGADNGLSPSDIEKYDISSGPATVLYDSPYHGDYAMCGNLWFAEDGGRIFTRCGNTFRTSEFQEDDMRYAGALTDVGLVGSLSHSTEADQVVVIPATSYWDQSTSDRDKDVWFYSYEFLSYIGKAPLPAFVINDYVIPARGRFVFHDSLGTKQYVLVQADAEAGLLHDWGLVKINGPVTPGPVPELTTVSPSAGPVDGGTLVTLTGSGFEPGLVVKFGDKISADVRLWGGDGTTVTATTPRAAAAGSVTVTVINPDDQAATLEDGYLYTTEGGDANGDGFINVSDVFYLINYLFADGPAPQAVPADGGPHAAFGSGSLELGEFVVDGNSLSIPVLVRTESFRGQSMALTLRWNTTSTVEEANFRRSVGVGKALFETTVKQEGSISYIATLDRALPMREAILLGHFELELGYATRLRSLSARLDPIRTAVMNRDGSVVLKPQDDQSSPRPDRRPVQLPENGQ